MNKNIRIAATGLSGLIGSRLQELLRNEFEFISLSQEVVDITNKQSVKNVFKTLQYDVFLHLAGYTNVDGAEKEKEIAWKINVEGTRNVFEEVSRQKKPFIYISTDFVFDGVHPPFYEDSIPHPISAYGLTKYEGEKVLKNQAMILRLSYPYRASFEGKKDIVRSLIVALKNKLPIQGVVDQYITFTFIDDIAYALSHLMKNYSPEIFHIVGADSVMAYESIKTIGDVFDLDTSFVGQTTYDEFYKNKAQRPQKGIIKSKKNTFYPMKTLGEGLREIKRQLS